MTPPEIFEPEDLAAFFKALTTATTCSNFTLLLQTGLREQEALHLERADIRTSGAARKS